MYTGNFRMKFDYEIKEVCQINLGRGPHRGAVAHIHRKVPIGYNGAPQICSQKYDFPMD